MKQPFFYILFVFILSAAGLGDARKGNDAFEKGDFVEAEVLYRAALENNPDNARLYFNLGNALAKQDKVQEALDAYMEFDKLSKTDSDKALAQYNMGTLLANGEKWEPAKLHLRNALKLDPSDAEAQQNYELASSKAEEEENEQQQDQENQDQKQKEPSEYALAMKQQAEKLVSEKKYKKAYDLMQQAQKVDETVSNFKDFIERIGSVDQIDS
tara:strand:- start:3210 stop:3848 length:639 start_codon:yes stop_codon:yes gene_type:complete